ncbi:MAG: ABC transporter permease subunit [Leptolyngbyaceae cyanobacterium CSU_1_4]|nr:ABC transporter permease subunit [Leptolyngbyaceae cyanobacterium CSU_1_4]
MTRKTRSSRKPLLQPSTRLISLIAVAIVLLLWFIASTLQWVSPLFLPAPQVVLAAFFNIFQQGYKGQPLWLHGFASLNRLFWAFLLTVATAIPLGLLSGCSRKVQALLDPFIEFYRPLPPLAYYTLLIIGLGIEDQSKIALLYLAGFAPLYLAALAGVKKIPGDRINAARSLGASGVQVFIYVIFPSTLPELFTGLRTAIGFMYTTLVAAEMVAAVSGLGWMVLDASKFLRSDVMIVGIFLMGGIAMLIDGGIRWIQHRQLPWMGRE